MCGWLKDKYGVSWQIVPAVPGKMMKDKNAERTGRVMKALLQMTKLDIKGPPAGVGETIVRFGRKKAQPRATFGTFAACFLPGRSRPA